MWLLLGVSTAKRVAQGSLWVSRGCIHCTQVEETFAHKDLEMGINRKKRNDWTTTSIFAIRLKQNVLLVRKIWNRALKWWTRSFYVRYSIMYLPWSFMCIATDCHFLHIYAICITSMTLCTARFLCIYYTQHVAPGSHYSTVEPRLSGSWLLYLISRLLAILATTLPIPLID